MGKCEKCDGMCGVDLCLKTHQKLQNTSSNSDYAKCGCGSTENTDVYCEKCLTKIAEQGN